MLTTFFLAGLVLPVATFLRPQDVPSILVPQGPSLTVIEQVNGRPSLRLGGHGRSVLQVLAPYGHAVRRLVPFNDRIEGAASVSGAVWISTVAGIYRLGDEDQQPVLVMPHMTGELLSGPDGLLGFLGTTLSAEDDAARSPLDGNATLAIIDAQAAAITLRTELPTSGRGGMAWIEGQLHGAGAGGRGFLSAAQTGSIRWRHVALDPERGTTTTLGSYSGPRHSRDRAGPVPMAPAWGDPGTTDVSRVTPTSWKWMWPSVLTGPGRLDHVTGRAGGGAWSLRLESDGAAALVRLDESEAPRWLVPSRASDWELGAFFADANVHGRPPLVLHLHHGNAQQAPAALVHLKDSGEWAFHRWTPAYGLGPSLGIVAEAVGPNRAPGVWAWHAGSAQFAMCDAGAQTVWVHTMTGGEKARAFEIPAPISAKQPGGMPASIRYLTWSADGARLLIHGPHAIAELDLVADDWSPVHELEDRYTRSFAVLDGWWVSGINGTCLARLGANETWSSVAIGVGDRVHAVEVARDGVHAAAINNDGHCVLFDNATGEIEARWVAVPSNDGFGQAAHFMGGGRFLVHATALPGHVRVLDLTDGSVYLEWQIVFGEESLPQWLIWTPDGASLGTTMARGQFSRVRGASEFVAFHNTRCRPKEVAQRIRRLFGKD